MKSMECLFVLSLVACLYVTLSTAAPSKQVSSQLKEHMARVRRDLGMSSWNIISPWEARMPCAHRMCWSHDDCCRGFVCVGISDWQDLTMPGTCVVLEKDFKELLDNDIDWS